MKPRAASCRPSCRRPPTSWWFSLLPSPRPPPSVRHNKLAPERERERERAADGQVREGEEARAKKWRMRREKVKVKLECQVANLFHIAMQTHQSKVARDASLSRVKSSQLAGDKAKPLLPPALFSFIRFTLAGSHLSSNGKTGLSPARCSRACWIRAQARQPSLA